MPTHLSTLAASNAVTRHLSPGENLCWSGQPRSGIRLRPQDAFLIPFSLLWCGGVIFWETAVIRSGAPLFFAIWGVPFLCVGLYIVFGRFIVDAIQRKHTVYGVTNERIFILSGLFSRHTKSLPLRTLTDVSLTERGDRSGTITFGPSHPRSAFLPAGAWPGSGRYASPAFEFIEAAKEVYDIIRHAQRAAPAVY